MIERVPKALEKSREKLVQARDERRRARNRKNARKEAKKYTVDGVDMRDEVKRLFKLSTFRTQLFPSRRDVLKERTLQLIHECRTNRQMKGTPHRLAHYWNGPASDRADVTTRLIYEFFVGWSGTCVAVLNEAFSLHLALDTSRDVATMVLRYLFKYGGEYAVLEEAGIAIPDIRYYEDDREQLLVAADARLSGNEKQASEILKRVQERHERTERMLQELDEAN